MLLLQPVLGREERSPLALVHLAEAGRMRTRLPVTQGRYPIQAQGSVDPEGSVSGTRWLSRAAVPGCGSLVEEVTLERGRQWQGGDRAQALLS